VPLAPKAYALLHALMSARPKVVSQLVLFQQVWQDTVVTESSLSTAVAELRRALGDTARDARYIRTAYGFGYAFVAAVTMLPPATGLDVPQAQQSHGLAWGDRYVAVPDGVHLVGRAPDALVAIDDPTVSRYHARLTAGPSALAIEDLASRNGTFRNGVRLTGIARLIDGDVVTVGSVHLSVRVALLAGTDTLSV
jgi:hypothetical protein